MLATPFLVGLVQALSVAGFPLPRARRLQSNVSNLLSTYQRILDYNFQGRSTIYMFSCPLDATRGRNMMLLPGARGTGSKARDSL